MFPVAGLQSQAVFIIFIFICVYNVDFCVESTLGCKVVHLLTTQTPFSECRTFVTKFFMFVSTKLACHKFLRYGFLSMISISHMISGWHAILVVHEIWPFSSQFWKMFLVVFHEMYFTLVRLKRLAAAPHVRRHFSKFKSDSLSKSSRSCLSCIPQIMPSRTNESFRVPKFHVDARTLSVTNLSNGSPGS